MKRYSTSAQSADTQDKLRAVCHTEFVVLFCGSSDLEPELPCSVSFEWLAIGPSKSDSFVGWSDHGVPGQTLTDAELSIITHFSVCALTNHFGSRRHYLVDNSFSVTRISRPAVTRKVTLLPTCVRNLCLHLGLYPCLCLCIGFVPEVSHCPHLIRVQVGLEDDTQLVVFYLELFGGHR